MIDEKKLIDALMNNDGMEFVIPLRSLTVYEVAKTTQMVVDEMKKGFINLINAQPKEEGWIPVTERLPDTFGEYNVAVKAMDGTFYSDYADYDRFAKKWTTGLFFEIGSKVTHWMPLPEPPKDGGGE